MMNTLSEQEIQQALHLLPNWEYRDNSIGKSFVLSDFKTVMTVMVAIGFYAEEVNHHPDWSNVYNQLNISLSTHDAGGVTQNDIDFALKVESIISKFIS